MSYARESSSSSSGKLIRQKWAVAEGAEEQGGWGSFIVVM